MKRDETLNFIQKILDMMVKTKFPEIEEIVVKDNDYMYNIHILVEGTDQEQEEEIEDSVAASLNYLGFKVAYGIKYHVEYWNPDDEINF